MHEDWIITLVHGTFARGLWTEFHDPGGVQPAPWCAYDSDFRRLLLNELNAEGYSAEVVVFNWSGNNTFGERNKAAHFLAKQLQEQSLSHPRSRRAVIAHSHGGNVLLRARYLLDQVEKEERKAAFSAVTLATPFTFLQKSLNEDTERNMDALGCGLTLGCSAVLAPLVGFPLCLFAGVLLARLIAAGLMGTRFEVRKRGRYVPAALSESAQALLDISYYPPLKAADRTLIVRGFEDEAAMALTIGSIGARLADILSYLTGHLFNGFLWCVPFVILVIIDSILTNIPDDGFAMTAMNLLIGLLMGLVLTLICLPIVAGFARSVFGKELLFGGSGLAVCGHSAPDSEGVLDAIILRRESQATHALLHSLYDHPDCAPTVARWIARQTVSS